MKQVTNEDMRLIIELYKSHHTPKEASKITGFSYSTIISHYRSFNGIKVKKYNRKLLFNNAEELCHARAINE